VPAAISSTDRKQVYRLSVWLWVALIAAGVLAALILPLFSKGVSFWFYLFQWIALASALNLMAGMTGYLPFGFVAFFGIGAYSASTLIQLHNATVWQSLLGAACAGALLAVLFAPTLRLSGVFFSIVSMSLAIVLKNVIALLPDSIAGGSAGITIAVARDPILYYRLIVLLAAASVLLATAIAVTPVGLRLKALRDDFHAAQMIGINVGRLRLAVWIVSGTIAALCGALEALYSSVVDPSASFNMLISAKAIIYAALGGLGTVIGPVVGAVLMTEIDELVWARFPVANLFILGAIISLAVLFFPKGLVGSLLERRPRFRRWFF
jgi:branched-chain amino acid transport system permease protein